MPMSQRKRAATNPIPRVQSSENFLANEDDEDSDSSLSSSDNDATSRVVHVLKKTVSIIVKMLLTMFR